MQVLRILHLEDDRNDAELLTATLLEAGIECRSLRVDSERDFVEALSRDEFDIILSDLSIPGYDGRRALAMARKARPDLPFIFVSGTIGEEAAIESLLEGATDYVLKDRYSRLVPAIQRAQRESEERRKRAATEARLAAASAQLRNLFENLDDVFLSIDPAHPELSQISPACERLTGRPAEEFRNDARLWLHCIHGEDREAAAEIVSRLLAGQAVRQDCRVVHRDGTVRWIECQLKPVKNRDGTTVRVDGALRDITDQRALERQFMRTQRIESIGTLASGIAHDLNNILTPILNAVQLLRDRTSDSRSLGVLNTLELSAVRGADLIRQILTFARGIEGLRKPVRLQDVFGDIAKILNETLPRSIRTWTDIPDDLWSLRGDATQLRQLLMNLCVNARDAMPDGGVLRISARNTIARQGRRWAHFTLTPGSYVQLEVGDTGQGIREDLLASIFEPFFTTKQADRGSGIGLFTVQAIVRSHHGFIEVATQVGKGSIFSVYLPAIAQEVAEQAPSAARSLPGGAGELVLVVDDEAAVRDIVSATLEAYGYQVITAVNGAEGLEIFRQRSRDIRIVLSDMSMPIMDGNAMIQAIREIKPNVAIVSASGLSSIDPTAPSGVERPHAFLQKPFTAQELLQAMNSARTEGSRLRKSQGEIAT